MKNVMNDENQIIKENLERRFEALLRHKNPSSFVMLEFDYIDYISRNKKLGQIIKELTQEGKISVKILQHFFNLFLLQSASRKYVGKNNERVEGTIVFPSFWSIELDEKFNLYKNFRQMLLDADKEYQEAKKEGRSKELFEFDNKERLDIVERNEDLYKVEKLHNDILEKLTENSVGVKNLLFDLDKSILLINDEQIPIRKFSEQYNLLKVIFTNKNKDWQFSEVAEIIDCEKESEWKRFYNIADAIKKKILIKTGIDDVLITTTQSILINKKYI